MDSIIPELSKLNLQDCKIHRYNKMNILQFSNKSKNNQMCIMCLQQLQIQSSEMMSIEYLLNADEDTVFQNFPPLADQQIQETLNLFSNETCVIDDKMKEMQNYFTDLRQQLDKLIIQMEYKVKQKITSLYELKDKVIEDYNKISSKQELQLLFTLNQNEINEKLPELLSDMMNNKKQNTEIMRKSISNFENMLDSFDLKTPNLIKKDIQEQIQQINFFPAIGNNNIKLNNQIRRNESVNVDNFELDENNENKRNDEILYNLIANKTNYCNEQSLQRIKTILTKFNKYLNKYKIGGTINDEKKANSFIQLENAQLENIRLLAEETQKVYNGYKTNNKQSQEVLNKQIQPNSFLIYANSPILVENNLQALLKKYPIFETVAQLTQNKSLLISTEFIQSKDSREEYDLLPQQKVIQRIQGNQIQMVQLSYQPCLVYTNFFLNPNKKYVFKLTFSYQQLSKDENIQFGLLTNQQLKNNILDYSLFHQDEDYNIYTKLTKRNQQQKIFSLDQSYRQKKEMIVRQLEIRIHLDEEIFIVANYPYYQNIYGLNNSHLNENEIKQRLFAIQLKGLGDIVTINDIQEVLEFEEII